jgi:hypothetical protein
MKNFFCLNPDLAGAPAFPELRWAWKMFQKWYALAGTGELTAQ